MWKNTESCWPNAAIRTVNKVAMAVDLFKNRIQKSALPWLFPEAASMAVR